VPRFILEPDFDVDVTHIPPTYGNLGIGASFGATDYLGVRALVFPLQLAGPAGNGFHYGQTSEDRGPSVGATLAFVHGAVELGVGLDLRVLTAQAISGVAIIPQVPLHIHLGRRVRLDVVPDVNVTRATSSAPVGPTTPSVSANAVRVDVPVTALFNLTETVHVGVNTGLTIYDFNDVRNTTGIPLGISAGYAFPGKHGPLGDINPFFNFPYLIMPGASAVTNTGEWVVGLRLDGFLYY
jgi:hypothetical protein